MYYMLRVSTAFCLFRPAAVVRYRRRVSDSRNAHSARQKASQYCPSTSPESFQVQPRKLQSSPGSFLPISSAIASDANGVARLRPLSPNLPPEVQATAFPSMSVNVRIVLLLVHCAWTMQVGLGSCWGCARSASPI